MSTQLPRPGDTIGGHFVLRRELGRGAHGVVYEAQQLGLERQVAIKMLLPDVLDKDSIIERFKREARLASALSSPHSVIIHAFGVHQTPQAVELPYLAMEYLHGEDLASYLRRVGVLSVDQTTVILRQILASLAEAHRKGIVHRDLKPENIFLCQRDNAFVVKVLDFGIAKAIEDTQTQGRRLTAEGMVCGTPEYMAPEQAKGLANITAAVDVYAVGCIVYHMLSGRPPFLGPTPMTIALKHCQDPPPKLPPSTRSTFYRELVARTLAKEPEERYRDAAELLTRVEDHYASSLGASTSGAWRSANPSASQELSLEEVTQARAGAESVIPDWALTTSPSMKAFLAPGEAEAELDVPAHLASFAVSVGGMGDVEFPSGPELPTILDPEDDEPEEVEEAEAPRPGHATVPVSTLDPALRARPGAARPRPRAAPAEKKIFFALAAGAGAIFLLLAVGVAVLAALAAREPEVAATPPTHVEQVRWTLSSRPSGAEVVHEGKVLGQTPFTRDFPRGAARVVLVLRREGYQEASVELSMERDGVRDVQLQRLPSSSWDEPSP